MNKLQKWAIGIIFVSVAAFATAEAIKTDEFAQFRPMQLVKGLYIGPTGKNLANPVLVNTNKIARSYGRKCDFDFPSIDSPYAGSMVTRDSAACALVGVQIGDPCVVGLDSAFATADDAGANVAGAMFSCYVSSADNVKIRIHPAARMDGGAGPALVDVADAGYQVRVFSYTP